MLRVRPCPFLRSKSLEEDKPKEAPKQEAVSQTPPKEVEQSSTTPKTTKPETPAPSPAPEKPTQAKVEVSKAPTLSQTGKHKTPRISQPLKPGKTEVRNTGSHIDLRYTEKEPLEVAPGQSVEVRKGAGIASAIIDKDKEKVILSKVHVDEILRGRGIPRAMMAQVAEESEKLGYELTTTGVLSPDGRRMLDKLVRDGYAKETSDRNYIIDSGKLIADYGKKEDRKSPPAPTQRSEDHSSVISHITYTLNEQAHLPEETRTKYKRAVERVVDRMPRTALPYLYSLQGVVWNSSPQQITERFKGFGNPVTEGSLINGFVNHQTGEVYLDGETEKRNAPGIGGDQKNIHGVYAHELTHIIDHKQRFSKSKEWKEAYLEEIVGDFQKPAKLSEYARITGKSYEGFAEFGRALYGSDVPWETLEQQFPKCFAYFKKHGLV